MHVSLSVAPFFFLIAFSLFNEKGIAILFVTIVLLVAFVRDMIAVFRVAGEYVMGGGGVSCSCRTSGIHCEGFVCQ